MTDLFTRATDALGFIDQTIYNVEDMPHATWRSDEVVAMLRELRSRLVRPVAERWSGCDATFDCPGGAGRHFSNCPRLSQGDRPDDALNGSA